MRNYDRNHDGAALGASTPTPIGYQGAPSPYTVQGGATIPDRTEGLRRQNMIHTTYLYLAVSVFACMASAWAGAHYKPYLVIVGSLGVMFWVLAMVAINFMPRIAMNVAEKNPRMAIPVLALNGAVSGLVLAPLIFVAQYQASKMSGGDMTNALGTDLVSAAVVITGAMFAAITAYVFLNKSNFQAKAGVMWGLFGFAIVAIPINMMVQSSFLELAVLGVVGLLGIWQLAVATSQILNNPQFNSPAAGALMLFAGVFNLFQVVLHLLMGGSRD